MIILSRRSILPNNTRSFLLTAFVLALTIRALVIVINYPNHSFHAYEWAKFDSHVPQGDDQRYLQIAKNLVDGRGFPVIHEQEPFLNDFRRPPLYMMVMAAVIALFSFDILFLLLTQAVIGSLSIFPIYKIANDQFNQRVARIAAIFWAVYPSSVYWTLAIYRETISTFVILYITWRFIVWYKRPSFMNASVLGVVIGIGLLFEPSVRALVYALLVFLAISVFVEPNYQSVAHLRTYGFGEIWKSVLARFKERFVPYLTSGIFVAFLTLASTAPWLVYFHQKNGYVGFVTGTEFTPKDNSLYFFSKRHARQTGRDIHRFEEEFIEYRFNIAKPFLGIADSVRPGVKEMLGYLETAKSNRSFLEALDRIGKQKRDSLLAAAPELYWGKPFGKFIAIRFFNIWLNFLVTHEPGSLVNISSLYVISRQSGTFALILGFLYLSVVFAAFALYILRGWRSAFLPFWIFMVPFLVLLRGNASSEGRYLLPFQPFAVMTLIHLILQYKNKNVKT